MQLAEKDTVPPPRPRNPTVTMSQFLELVKRVEKLEEEKAKRGRPPKQEE